MPQHENHDHPLVEPVETHHHHAPVSTSSTTGHDHHHHAHHHAPVSTSSTTGHDHHDMHAGHGKIKLALALCRGKKTYDKRASIKEREQKREISRAVRERE